MGRLILFLLLAVAGCAQKPILADFREMKDSQTGKMSYAVLLYPMGDQKDFKQISFLCEAGQPVFFSILLNHPISRQKRVTLAYEVDDAHAKAFYAVGDESGGVWFEKDREGSIVRTDWTAGSKLDLHVSVTDDESYEAAFDISSLRQMTERLDAACQPPKPSRH